MIYEGTNGIQAMDLVGRKLFKNGGAHVARFAATMLADLGGQAPEGLEDFHEACRHELARLEEVTAWLLDRARQKAGALPIR